MSDELYREVAVGRTSSVRANRAVFAPIEVAARPGRVVLHLPFGFRYELFIADARDLAALISAGANEAQGMAGEAGLDGSSRPATAFVLLRAALSALTGAGVIGAAARERLLHEIWPLLTDAQRVEVVAMGDGKDAP